MQARRSLRVLAMHLLLAAFFCSGLVFGQEAAQERLRIDNKSKKNISVSIRSGHPSSPNKEWQTPIDIGAGKPGAVTLRGFEPFDIAIRQEDGTYFIAERIMLCTFMRECARTGRSDYRIRFRPGQYVDGKFEYDKESGGWDYPVKGDAANIHLEWGQVDYDPPRPPNRPPRPPRKQ